ncbi:class I SAM-dependent methyltransferase [Bradyrhizobium sp. GCM10028915]|uniref:class I SAM-dependent methyltransferase n=1 Tax=Bradyrhizobium sp. GCM10028915 TaxID=3273385 RepID=UPI0036157172
MQSAADFYDEKYFKRQAPHGKIQGQANLFKFEQFIAPDAKVLDFGCGGGFLLNAITAADKIGIEINPMAVASAKSLGVEKVYPDTSLVETGWADVIVSNHALEHVEEPSRVLREFQRILRPGGKLIIVTPYDSVSMRFREKDPDFHLHGWSPSNIGNLAKATGFRVIEAKELFHRWPPLWSVIWTKLGPGAFHVICWFYSLVSRKRTQVRLVAERL